MSKCQTQMCIQCIADLLFNSSKTCLIRPLVNPLLIFIPILTFSLFVRNPSHRLFQHKISLPASACWINQACRVNCMCTVNNHVFLVSLCFSQSSNLLNQSRLKILKTREDLLKVIAIYLNILQFLFSSLGNANGMGRKETCYCDFTFKHELSCLFLITAVIINQATITYVFLLKKNNAGKKL